MMGESGESFVKQTDGSSVAGPKYASEEYLRARPRYPESLFSFLASLTPSHAVAWDVGTGNGQAAIGISEYYEKVIATDVAAEQLKYAVRRPNITYKLTPRTLSQVDLTHVVGPEGSVDLILVAEALHWFDLDAFYKNVKHVLRKPGGVIAATSYRGRPSLHGPLKKAMDEFYTSINRYWLPEVQYVENNYKDIPFPFESVLTDEQPLFELTMDANLDEFLTYLRTWSSVQTAIDEGYNPLSEHQRKLFADAWGSPEMIRCLRWPLVILAGTIPSGSHGKFI